MRSYQNRAVASSNDQVSIYLDPILHLKVKKLAEHEDRSKNWILSRMIEQAIRAHEEEHGPIEVSEGTEEK